MSYSSIYIYRIHTIANGGTFIKIVYSACFFRTLKKLNEERYYFTYFEIQSFADTEELLFPISKYTIFMKHIHIYMCR